MKNFVHRIVEKQKTVDFIAPSMLSDLDLKDSLEELLVDGDSVGISEGFMGLKSKIELFSPEDLAWVDSCLVADSELSMGNWVSLEEALINSITAFADSYEENNAAGFDEDGTCNGEQMEVVEEEVARLELANVDLADAHIRELKNHIGDSGNKDDREDEIQKDVELRENIFRVWNLQVEPEEKEDELIPELKRAVADLHIADEEEDQFISELKRSVAESILRDMQIVLNDEESYAEDKLDELISSLGDLSLKPASNEVF